jgi:ligand-binding SRPBCC domain-containing protein
MAVIRSRSWVSAPIEAVFAFFDDPSNLSRLMPPPVSIRVDRVEPSPPQAGSTFEFRYGIGPVQRRWVVRLLERIPPERMVDETISGPMERFHHAHSFTRAVSGTWIDDVVDYHVGPDGPVGDVVDLLAGCAMRATFVWRAAKQRRLLRD